MIACGGTPGVKIKSEIVWKTRPSSLLTLKYRENPLLPHKTPA